MEKEVNAWIDEISSHEAFIDVVSITQSTVEKVVVVTLFYRLDSIHT